MKFELVCSYQSRSKPSIICSTWWILDITYSQSYGNRRVLWYVHVRCKILQHTCKPEQSIKNNNFTDKLCCTLNKLAISCLQLPLPSCQPLRWLGSLQILQKPLGAGPCIAALLQTAASNPCPHHPPAWTCNSRYPYFVRTARTCIFAFEPLNSLWYLPCSRETKIHHARDRIWKLLALSMIKQMSTQSRRNIAQCTLMMTSWFIIFIRSRREHIRISIDTDSLVKKVRVLLPYSIGINKSTEFCPLSYVWRPAVLFKEG